jgi:signal transduction histidine kinase/CheY-like chemotaxis protein/integral membrane sensor domain MASE1
MSSSSTTQSAVSSWQRFLPVDVLLVALLYFCVARIALVFAFEKTNASPFWPPAGLAFAALIVLGPRALPGILAGAVGANIVAFVGNGVGDVWSLTWWSLVIGAGNTMGALAGWRVAGSPRSSYGFILDTRCALRLVAGAMIAGLLAGLVGATMVVFGTGLPPALWQVILRIWSLGDTLGILVVTPLLLHWWCPPVVSSVRYQWVSYATVVALVLTQVVIVPANGWPIWLMAAVPFLALALRSRRTAWTIATAVMLFVIWQTIAGDGPLARSDENQALFNVQLTLPLLAVLLVADGWWLRQPVRSSADEGLDLLFSAHLPYRPARVIPALGITALGVTITFFTWTSLLREQNERIERTADETARLVGGHFLARLDDLQKAIQRMALRWEDSKGIPEDQWRRNAHNFNHDYGCLQALEWIDRDTVIRWIEPLAGNEAALGLRLSDEPVRRATLERAVVEKRATFTSLVTLKQGGLGFVMYMPVSKDGTNDGFLVAVFRLGDFLHYLQHVTEAWDDAYHLVVSQEGEVKWDSLGSGMAAIPAALKGREVTRLRLPITIHAVPTQAVIAKQTSSLPGLVLNCGLLLSTLIGLSITLVGVALTHAERSREASRAKARFLATMSHEIRTPMNGILGAVELALARPLDQEARKHLSLVDQCGRTLLAIINDILDFSKIESGKLELERVPLDLGEECRQVVSLLMPLAQEKGLTFTASIDPAVPPAVLGDSVRLRQVLLNLLSNALKFTSRGSVTLDLRVTGGTADRPQLQLTCRDTGIGMDEHTVAALFTPFMQADASTTRRFGGTGLGLAIVHQIVGMWGGTIRCDSSPGQGSTFIITLTMQATRETPRRATPMPVELTPPTSAALPPKEVAAALAQATATTLPTTDVPPADATLRVLLAEDNPINQRIAEAMLKRCGCVVESVPDGAAAVERCRTGTFALVFMDMQMPVMDGIEACRRIRATEGAARHVPIIALTANAFSEDEAACRAAGMDAFLAKPVRAADLQAMITRFTHAV